MTAVENINKLAKYLKINPGKITVDENNFPIRTTKSGTISGYASILHSFARELPNQQPPTIAVDPSEAPFLLGQWFDYSAQFGVAVATDKACAEAVLQDLNHHLLTRNYLVGQALSIADVAVFLTVAPLVASLSNASKERCPHLCRWFDHVQRATNFRQPSTRDFVSFVALQLGGDGRHF